MFERSQGRFHISFYFYKHKAECGAKGTRNNDMPKLTYKFRRDELSKIIYTNCAIDNYNV